MITLYVPYALYGLGPIDILPLDSRCINQLMFTRGGTSVCLQRLYLPAHPSLSEE
jgi:hypothetical protein